MNPLRWLAVLALTSLVASACSLDATDGAGPAGAGLGALGDSCTCANGQPECSDARACQVGLVCARARSGSKQTCTKLCPCPLGFSCSPAENGLPRCFQ